MILNASLEELQYMLLSFPPTAIWPAPYARWDADFLPPGEQGTAGGAPFRLKVIAARQYAVRNPNARVYPLEITLAELWLIEQVLGFVEFSKARMANGSPVLELANKVWDLCIQAHIDRVQLEFLPSNVPTRIVPPEELARQRARLAEIDQVIGDAE